MVTGKSPKVINIALLPRNLQQVVAKALEESKEERFQSVLEMKEAFLQAATAGLNAAIDLGEGECPSCGTTNPSDRKFCRNADCAVSLEVDCLSCKTAMPMWEAVCGSCGAKQNPLLEEIRKTHQARHDEAEIFLNEFKFDDALRVASAIGVQNDLRLQQFATWHEEFSTRVESSKTSEHARLEELLGEALAHEQAHDFESGLQTLAQIAPVFRLIPHTGISNTATEITERLSAKHTRRQELEAIVRERVTKKEFVGLKPIVTELLMLKPERPEVLKLKEQLEKRDADLLEAQQERTLLLETEFELAQLEFDSFNYEACVEIITKLGPSADLPFKHLELRKRVLERLERVEQLKSEFSNFADDDVEAFPILEEYLLLRPGHEGAKKRLERLRPGYSAMVSIRRQERRTSNTIKTLIAIALLFVLVGVGVGIKGSLDGALMEKNETEIKEFLADGNYQRVLTLDPDNAAALAIKKRSDELSMALANGDYQTALLLDSTNPTALAMQTSAEEMVAAKTIVAQNSALEIATGLAKGDWKAVLALDPNNNEGKRLKAVAEKTDKIATGLAKGDWKTVLALDPNNSEGKRLKGVAEKTDKIAAALVKGDWKAVLALDANNSEGKRLKEAAEKRARMAALSTALAKRDWKAVLALDPNNEFGLRLKDAAYEKTAILTGAPITNTRGMTFHKIPAGTFTMGSLEDETGEDQHKVTISKTFYIQTTEVTQSQWKAVMETQPWKSENYVREGANYAATYISWDDAVAYCKKLSEKEDKTYRLPTEAEWEYACRAGIDTRWSFGDDEKALGDYAWYDKNALYIEQSYAHLVGLKKPNAFGLYDMHGNVYEWCHDYLGEDYYQQSPEKDPTGPTSGSLHALRGGAWLFSSLSTRSPSRVGREADFRVSYTGFRVVRELD
ncbi:MAG TPA: hypothetical protein EYG51_19750 [Pseudomonadales bacterium]|nr:hypothetical protein [Pseudomonadales bacterium]